MCQFSSEWIKVSEPFPTVYHVELARKPVNAFSYDFWRAYGKVFDDLSTAHASGTDIRAVVVSSAMPKLFTAGLDLDYASELLGGSADGARPTQQDSARAFFSMRQLITDFQYAIGAPDRCLFPVIVAVHGLVVGLGVDIIGACDIRYASKDTVFSIKEVDIGLAPDIGTLAYLPKVTGNLSLLRELTYTGRMFNAREAEKLGLLSKVVDGGRDEVVQAALGLAQTIAQKSPVAVASSKHLITHSRDQTVANNLSYTGTWNGAALMTRDISENLCALKTKETAKFKALLPPKSRL